jgi:Zn-dependent peptidase ImmA (M78 family)
VLINSSQSIGRQNFTVCHELYHIYYDPDFTPHKCQTGTFPHKGGEEYNADVFASYLLLPEEGVADMIPGEEIHKDKISLSTLLKIEQTYRSSRTALLMRLKKMKLISQGYYDEYSNGVKQSARRYGYLTTLYEPTNEKLVIGPYGSLANKLFDNNHISEGHYRELMSAIGIDINEFGND